LKESSSTKPAEITGLDARDSGTKKHAATSLRALVTGSILALGHVVFMTTASDHWRWGTPTRVSLVSTMLFVFFWLVMVNRLWRRWNPAKAFGQGELLVIFSLMSVASAFPGADMGSVLVQLWTEGIHAANDVNKYSTTVLPFVLDWIRITDPKIVKVYFEGTSSLFAGNHLQAFAGPIFWWSLCIISFLIMSFCANTLLRRQWSRNEHLTFPLIHLPVAMSEQKAGGLFANRVFWIGFAFAGGVSFLSGLHQLFPTVPYLNMGQVSEMRYWIKSPIWDAMDWTPINLFPFAIGMAYMIPVELLFSLTVFTWVWKFERIIPTALGVGFYISPWPLAPGFPYYAHQMIGVWLAMLGIMLWTARHHLRGVFRQIIRPGTGLDDRDEGISYRTALIGVILGLAGVTAFFLAMGITPTMVVPYTVMLLGFSIVLARIRAELGPITIDPMGAGPDKVIYTFISPLVAGPRSFATFYTMTFWLHRESVTTYPQSAHIDALKMGEISGGLNRRFLMTMTIVSIIAAVLAMWIFAYWGFLEEPGARHTEGRCAAFCVWNGVGGAMQDTAIRPNWNEIIALFIGAGLTVGLFVIHNLGINLPLNPIAYLLSSGILNVYWFPVLIALVIKFGVLRYGGFGLHRKVVPFFFGLILGQFIIGLSWQTVAVFLGLKGFRIT
jgi:hypothetical protein